MSSRSNRLPTLVSLARTCSPSAGPIGAIMMPPLDSWSTNGRGRLSKAAQATMRSNGPSSGSPLPPSAWRTMTLADAERLETLPGLLDQRLVAIVVTTRAAEPRHHRCRCSRSRCRPRARGARLDVERRDHRRLHVGAFDRLAAFDRHHAVRPGDRWNWARQENHGAVSPRKQRSAPSAGVPRAAQAQQKGGEAFAIVDWQPVHASALPVGHDFMRGEIEMQRRHRHQPLCKADRSVPARLPTGSRPKRSQ